jgi:hypothetical protein
MKGNETKSVHVTFTTRLETCPPVHINDVQIPLENHVKYLGLHLDRRLTWHTHIFVKRKQLGLSLTKMYWLLGRKSKLSTNNNPIWTYGIQLWGTTSNSNIEILERSHSKVLRLIVVAPWYVSNSVIRKDLQIPTIKRRNQPLKHPLRCSPPCTHQCTYRVTHRAANPQASAPILAPTSHNPIGLQGL